MKKHIILLVLTLLFFGCSNQKKSINNGVSLELINEEIHYIAIDSNSLLKSEEKSYDDLKSYTIEERKKACNILSFKLVNNSNKKYYFVLDPNIFFYSGNSSLFEKAMSNDTISRTNMCYLIDNKKSNKNSIQITSRGNITSKNDSVNIYFKKYLEIKNNIERDIAIHINRKNHEDFGGNPYINHSFVLYPGEYKIFKQKLYLPIDTEKSHSYRLDFNALIIPSENDYDFSLSISARKKFIWNSLYDYQRKEIIDNGYEIFDGTILSNKVPLKLKK